VKILQVKYCKVEWIEGKRSRSISGS